MILAALATLATVFAVYVDPVPRLGSRVHDERLQAEGVVSGAAIELTVYQLTPLDPQAPS